MDPCRAEAPVEALLAIRTRTILRRHRHLRHQTSSNFAVASVPSLYAMRNCFAAFLFAVACALSQTPAPAPEGVASEWEVKAKMVAMAADVAHVEDLLARVRPNEWIAKGAPDAYLQQLQSSKTSVQLLIAATEKIAKEPEKLSAALDALFRMDSMDLFLQSLKEGVRKYQGPSLADDIARFIADNSRHRDMLRQHSVELAAARENELKVIQGEAQRCRTELSRKDAPESQPRPEPKPRRSRRNSN